PARFNVFGPLGSTTEVEPQDMLLTFGLKKAGYSTHLSGKWHIGDEPSYRPLKYGYDSSYGYLRGQIDPYTHRYKYGNYVTWHRNDQFIEEEGHVTNLITDEAIRVIYEHDGKEKAKPFFLHVAHHAPHFPHNSSPKWIEPYEKVFDDHWRQHTAATITQMDYEIGRILEALEKTGERQNTIIVFMSDNGGQESWGAPVDEYNGRYAPHTTLGDNSPYRGWKTDLYEGGIRVPAFVNWNGKIQAGGEIDAPVHVLDLAPTFLYMANSDLMSDDRLAGKNLWPFIMGKKSQSELTERLFYWRQSDTRAIRDGAWKVIAQGETLKNPELFIIESDPLEHHEVGDKYPDKRNQLLDLMLEWEKKIISGH
ncbi:MAG: sulfatase-like hydrolase/transferase, partial [Bacteroidetes bacterium]|nr:sulfatase-like hydrolase/transferase [Bacteroidota bacterium]